MNYISFMFFTTNPTLVWTRLVNRGWMEAYPDSPNPDFQYRPTMEHLEIVEVPQALNQTAAVLNQDGTVQTPAVPYPQRAFAVKISGLRMADETSEDEQYDAEGNLREQIVRTKIGKWVALNSSAVDVVGYLGISQTPVTFRARKLNNVNVWLVRDDDVMAYFHNWL